MSETTTLEKGGTRMSAKSVIRPTALVVGLLGWVTAARGVEHITLERDARTMQIQGRILTEAQDGGLLLITRGGVLWTVQPEELVDRKEDNVPFEPFGPDELAERLLAELPESFEVQKTAHYLICHGTSPTYARFCGSLFERLYTAFTNYWSFRGFDLSEPEFPLVALVFPSKESFAQYAQSELGEATASVIGYFSLRTNRMAMYDLTGLQAAGGRQSRAQSTTQIGRILAQPEAARTVATVVHEATHQMAFNCGLHQRYSDCPIWFSEGIAIFFETPDLTSRRGWRSIGKVNRPRLAHFRQYLRKRPADSLQTLISTDDRFRDTSRALDAYAESWALTYFLLERYRDQYVEYLDSLSEKKPLFYDNEETRLQEFKEAFGEDLKKLDSQFVRFVMTRLR
jgi:hypothetical protein